MAWTANSIIIDRTDYADALADARAEGRAEGMREAAGIAYREAGYVKREPDGSWSTGSPYDRGQFDAQQAILAAIPAPVPEQGERETVELPAHPITVFDWAYVDPRSGQERYARTPERAEQLVKAGVKVRPVYDLENARAVQAILDENDVLRARLRASDGEPAQGELETDSEAIFDWLQQHYKSVGVPTELREMYRKYTEATAAARLRASDGEGV